MLWLRDEKVHKYATSNSFTKLWLPDEGTRLPVSATNISKRWHVSLHCVCETCRRCNVHWWGKRRHYPTLDPAGGWPSETETKLPNYWKCRHSTSVFFLCIFFVVYILYSFFPPKRPSPFFLYIPHKETLFKSTHLVRLFVRYCCRWLLFQWFVLYITSSFMPRGVILEVI